MSEKRRMSIDKRRMSNTTGGFSIEDRPSVRKLTMESRPSLTVSRY